MNNETEARTLNVRRPDRFTMPDPGQSMQINEPTVSGRLRQIRETLATMELHAAAFDSEIFGRGDGGLKPAVEPASFEDQLAEAGTRLACMCGFLATINSRFGVGSAPKSIGQNGQNSEPGCDLNMVYPSARNNRA